jgi:NADPH2:quinone reductase
MRAVVCREFGSIDDLEVADVSAPTAGPNEVVVATEACGVQFVDNRVIEGQSLLNTGKLDAHFGRSMKVTMPLTPGSEAAGVVKSVGPGVESVRPGDRVFGTCLFGAYAEQVLFHELEVARIPNDMPMTAAAGFYSAYFTAYYALIRRGRLAAGETVLVLGAGSGVGLAAIEIAKATDAIVIAAASSDTKLELARRHGADVAIEYPLGPLSGAEQRELASAFKAAAGKPGIAVVADLVGGTYAEPAMRSMAFKGRFLSIGFAAGVPSIPMHVIFNKNGALLGIEPVSEGRLPVEKPDIMQTQLRWIGEGTIRPEVAEVYPLEEAATALRRLAQRQAAGRIALSV